MKFILLILKNLMQGILDTIIGEHQLEATKNRIILHFLLFDISNEWNKNLSVISLDFILSFLLGISLDMETSSFTWLKLIYMIIQYRI